MIGHAPSTREERLNRIRANLVRAYYPRPLKLPERMQELMRELNKSEAEDAGKFNQLRDPPGLKR